MASENQVAANRRNAAKSTGPKTAQGKQVVRMNALKHGLRAERVVIPGEDPEEFEALFQGLQEDWQPVGARENLLVERLAYRTIVPSGVVLTWLVRHLMLGWGRFCICLDRVL